MEDLPAIYDSDGNVRVLATQPPSDLNVQCPYPRFQDAKPDWMISESDIIKGLQNPDRVPRRKLLSHPDYIIKGDQKSIGSCDAWTVANMYTVHRFERRGGQPGQEMDFYGSGSYIYSEIAPRDSRGNSLDRGSALVDAFALENGTVDVSVCGPMTWQRKQCQQFDDAASVRKLAPDAKFWCKSWEEYIAALYMRGVGNHVVMCDNGSNFASYNGSGLIPVTHGIGNHSITGIDVTVYKGKVVVEGNNHWGPNWGDSGFFKMGPDSIDETLDIHGIFVSFSTYEPD